MSICNDINRLDQVESESIQIKLKVVTNFGAPVMLYSIEKGYALMLCLAMRAFLPGKVPFPLLHIDATWKFRKIISFRNNLFDQLKLNLFVHINDDGLCRGIGPLTHGSILHIAVMKTASLKQALEKFSFDAALGRARRDDERSHAKDRIFSFRDASHWWSPKNQRLELWSI